ncbi:CPBP family intramembrane glutamic endopeptidase [Eilatimonas milleporae]|uniref:Membrane protease YdiL (CAAX protease family) n=1 Tax=Eilatimonas milleporae TaxID=911205 RepID=A0A3M0CT32_9PROT|nr:type II CAAX endopeptidase family protein [Eilatimonas milleporae]RMB12711.1 membrane protease YdiL (CAAX protease family) [Eilatimonas milleporae]
MSDPTQDEPAPQKAMRPPAQGSGTGQRLDFWRPLGLFAGFLLLFAAMGYLLILELGLKRYYIALLMWTPGLAAMAALRLSGHGLSSLGWHWGPTRWHWIAYFLPPAYGLAAYGLIWSLGLGGVPNPKYIEEVAYFMALPAWPEWAMIVFSVVMIASVGMLWHFITALGEEIGWRGFLVPHLMQRVGFAHASVLSGLVWAAWHIPLIYGTSYNAGPSGLHMQMLNFTLLSVGLSFAYTYLRLKSGSLWPVTTLHAAHNVFILSIFQPMTLAYEDTRLYANEFGIVLPLVSLAVALYFWRKARAENLDGPLSPAG